MDNGKILNPTDHKYMVLNDHLKEFSLEPNRALLEDFAYLNNSFKRYDIVHLSTASLIFIQSFTAYMNN